MLFCIRLETFAVLRGRPGLALPVLPSPDVVDSSLLHDPARLGENQVGEESGVGVGVEGEGEGLDEDGGIRAWGAWKDPAFVEIKSGAPSENALTHTNKWRLTWNWRCPSSRQLPSHACTNCKP
jgi:hypothetical protein